MKNLHLLFLAVAISFSSVVSASTGNDPKKAYDSKTTVNAEITKLLADPNLVLEEDVTAHVLFTVNKHHEIVVLSVDSKHEFVKDFVKKRLNYKKIKSKLSKEVREFKLPVRIKA